jgi:hypothetical protein
MKPAVRERPNSIDPMPGERGDRFRGIEQCVFALPRGTRELLSTRFFSVALKVALQQFLLQGVGHPGRNEPFAIPFELSPHLDEMDASL